MVSSRTKAILQRHSGGIVSSRNRETTIVQFKEVNATGVFLSATKANYVDSKDLLEKKGLRLLTYSEALVLLDKNAELKEQLKDKSFYLAGDGIEESGFYIFDEKGKLTKTSSTDDVEKTVNIVPGPLRLTLYVTTHDAFPGGWRFTILANWDPATPVSVVVGIKINSKVTTNSVAKQALRA